MAEQWGSNDRVCASSALAFSLARLSPPNPCYHCPRGPRAKNLVSGAVGRFVDISDRVAVAGARSGSAPQAKQRVAWGRQSEGRIPPGTAPSSWWTVAPFVQSGPFLKPGDKKGPMVPKGDIQPPPNLTDEKRDCGQETCFSFSIKHLQKLWRRLVKKIGMLQLKACCLTGNLF